MGKKEKKEKKEKPIDKMTTKELRDLALSIGNISGVHGMNKAELVSEIKQARGIAEEKKEKTTGVRELKANLAALRAQKETLRETGDRKKLDILRRKISKIKKQTRRAA